jgi:hypothetical protein
MAPLYFFYHERHEPSRTKEERGIFNREGAEGKEET